MKKSVFTLLLALCFNALFGQSNSHRILVMMAEQYKDTQLSQKTALMTKQQRRDFVIAERKAFCHASQAQVIDFLNGFKDANHVDQIQQFWSINGFSCVASDEVIALLAERKDVAWVGADEMRLMVPETEKPHPITAKDIAWHVDKINAPAVWNYESTGFTGQNVIVAILDTGVNYNHIDIANSMWDGGNEYPHHGYDVVNHDDDPMDDHGHGSHCAGIVAGQGTAGTQTGVAPGAKIMAIKMMSAEGQGGDAELIGGVEFALEHGADILSCSFGDPGVGGYSVYRQLYETVLDAGVVAAVAAGNDGQTQYAQPVPYNIESPGNCPPPWFHPDQTLTGGRTAVVSIGATDNNDAHSAFSSVGPVTWAEGAQIGEYNDYPYENGNAAKPGLIRPDISAPGSNITSLNYATNDGYVAYDGTSMATPCAAGVMALLLEANPELLPAEIDSIIELTAVKIGNSKKNNITGSGRIDALAAINALFYHGPTQLTADFDGETVVLNWVAAPEGISYTVYRDGLPIATGLTATTYTDHLSYGGSYTYYVTAQLANDMTSLPSNYVTLTKTVEIEAEVINNMRVSLSWNLPAGIYDGFESGDFYQNMWINDATSPWVVTDTQPNTGTYCAKSTNTGMFSNSKISLAVNLPTTSVVSYYARVSCFPLNGCGFFVDNVQYGETLKDEVPWTRYTVTIGPGNHILEWKYANQLNEGEYDNAFYIDDITVGNTYDIYRTNCDGSNVELIASNVADAQYVDYGWDALPIGQYKYGISADGGNAIAWSECLDKDVLSVAENNAMEIKVYPNPTNGILFVQTCHGASLQAETEYCITNLTGQTLLSGRISEETQQIDVTGLSEGMYFVRIQNDREVTIKKFTIAK